ncbi:MAG: 50S ribosomal protein L28 [Parcubacteria group bacterium]|nr:50S ribosomal protein L28 [Parcubacteria group bacterium]
MAQCDICKRQPLKANWKSHSQVKTIRRQKLNLQSKKIDGKKISICTSCLKNLAKSNNRDKAKKNKETKK